MRQKGIPISHVRDYQLFRPVIISRIKKLHYCYAFRESDQFCNRTGNGQGGMIQTRIILHETFLSRHN
jgi:hypothetical protein